MANENFKSINILLQEKPSYEALCILCYDVPELASFYNQLNANSDQASLLEMLASLSPQYSPKSSLKSMIHNTTQKKIAAKKRIEQAETTDRNIKTGGGAYIGRNVDTGGGDFVGRDQVKIGGTKLGHVAETFEKIYTMIEADTSLSAVDKADLKADSKDIQQEVSKKDEADESFLIRRFRSIKRIAPNILVMMLTMLSNPRSGFSNVVIKAANKAKMYGSTM